MRSRIASKTVASLSNRLGESSLSWFLFLCTVCSFWGKMFPGKVIVFSRKKQRGKKYSSSSIKRSYYYYYYYCYFPSVRRS